MWANVKFEVGRQYTTDTTLQHVQARLPAALAALKPTTVAGCIRKANAKLLALHSKIFEADKQADDASGAHGGGEVDPTEHDYFSDSTSGSDLDQD